MRRRVFDKTIILLGLAGYEIPYPVRPCRIIVNYLAFMHARLKYFLHYLMPLTALPIEDPVQK